MTAQKPLKQVDVIRFFEARKVPLKCTTCDRTEFNLHNETANNSRMGSIGFKFPSHDLLGADIIDTVMLACSHCAKVQFFARQPIVEWVAANPSN